MNQDNNQNNSMIQEKEVKNIPQLTEKTLSDLEKLGVNKLEFAIAEFSSIPRSLREETLRNFCKRYEINERTYYRLVESQNVIKARRILTKAWFSKEIPDVLMALKNKALTGDVFAVKTFLQYVDDWNSIAEEDERNDKKIYVREQINIVISNLKSRKLSKLDKVIDIDAS